MRKYHVKPIFDVRWRFEYTDGTAPKWGQWTRAEIDYRKMASFQKTENLARAIIEVRDKRTFETSMPVTCTGDDFVMFKWDCVASVPAAMNMKIQECTPITQISGLILVTRELEVIVRVDGTPPVVRKRTDGDKKYHYEGFGK